jgi:hypothetical protein
MKENTVCISFTEFNKLKSFEKAYTSETEKVLVDIFDFGTCFVYSNDEAIKTLTDKIEKEESLNMGLLCSIRKENKDLKDKLNKSIDYSYVAVICAFAFLIMVVCGVLF